MDIYLGFYNKASNCYVGHDGKGKVVATATKQKSHEAIVARPRGYKLFMTHWGD